MTIAADTLYLQLAEPGHESRPPGRTDETRTAETSDRDAILAGQLLVSGVVAGGSR